MATQVTIGDTFLYKFEYEIAKNNFFCKATQASAEDK